MAMSGGGVSATESNLSTSVMGSVTALSIMEEVVAADVRSRRSLGSSAGEGAELNDLKSGCKSEDANELQITGVARPPLDVSSAAFPLDDGPADVPGPRLSTEDDSFLMFDTEM